MRLPDPDIVNYGTDPQILRSHISFYPETRNREIKIARKVPAEKSFNLPEIDSLRIIASSVLNRPLG